MTRASSEVLSSTAGELLSWYAEEAGKGAGGSGGPAFPPGACLTLTLGMWDKCGATPAAWPQNPAHIALPCLNLLSNFLNRPERKTTCFSYRSSLCRKLASFTFFCLRKELKFTLFPGWEPGKGILSYKGGTGGRELHVPGTCKDALTSSGGWGPGGS